MEKVRLFFKEFYDGFKSFGLLISTFVNFILLMIVYFTALGLTSLIGKLFGKNFLELKTNKQSFWYKRINKTKKLEDHLRPF